LFCISTLIASGYFYVVIILVEVGWGDVDWIGLAQDRDRRRVLANSALNLRVP
jgi:hypothetical protein